MKKHSCNLIHFKYQVLSIEIVLSKKFNIQRIFTNTKGIKVNAEDAEIQSSKDV